MRPTETRSTLSPTRRALLVAGVATLGLSLVMTIAPAWAKNANSGTVKIHDLGSGSDYSESANDPTVCDFTIRFFFSDPTGVGTWEIVTWNGGSEHVTVASGTYDTTASGAAETDPIHLSAGHYRLGYVASGANEKTKTFWVGDECGAGSDPSSEPSSAPSDPSSSPSDDPSSDPSTQPSDDPSSEPSQAASSEPSTDPGDDPSSDPSTQPSDDPSSEPSTQPSDDPSSEPSQAASSDPSSEPSQAASSDPSTSPVVVDPSAPPSDDHSADPTAAPSSDPSDLPQEGGVEGTTGTGGATNDLPDTSFADSAALTSLLTAVGLLMIIGAHPFIRRSAHADRA